MAKIFNNDAQAALSQFEIVCCLELIDPLVYNYLYPITLHPNVSRLWIVRSHTCDYGHIPKSSYVLTPNRPKPLRWLQMFRQCRKLAGRPEVKAFVSFNPIPYGLIAGVVARQHQKPIHYGFIGSDWYRNATGRRGAILRPLLKNADIYTATGEQMKQDMMAHGFDGDRVAILPHSIDLARFNITDPNTAEYTFIFVGQLIKRKRVDLILKAFAQVLTSYPDKTLCIVGEGPFKAECQSLAEELDVGHRVTFTGYRKDTEIFMQQARIMVMASDMEGFPFALVEAMCSGLVPISTPVGTIPDLIHHEENGLLSPCDDVNALAEAMKRIVKDDRLYTNLRDNILATRSDFSYERATEVWDEWIKKLA